MPAELIAVHADQPAQDRRGLDNMLPSHDDAADEIRAIDPEPQFGVDRSTEPVWPRIDLAPQVPCSIKLGVIALGLGRRDRRLRLGHDGRWRARRLAQPIRWATDNLVGAGRA